MRLRTFSDAGFEKYRKKTRKVKFLREMEKVVRLWKLVKVTQSYYPKQEVAGRRSISIEQMLRIHFV